MRWRHGFGASELLRVLRMTGIQSGDALLVHSGMGGFEGFRGSLSSVVATFEDAVGPDGTLMMPALSMSGSALEFANSGRMFDPRTTPSQVGLLTEVFRRSPGVCRSVHPTHSVCAWGKDKDWWLADHHLAGTPCGRGTPFYRLLERNGKIVLAGVPIATMTFFHCTEELLEPCLPFSPFTSERFVLRCRVEGKMIETAPMRLYDPEISKRRQLAPLEAELRKKNRWREGHTGSLHVIVLSAHEVLRTLKEMSERGAFCYEAP